MHFNAEQSSILKCVNGSVQHSVATEQFTDDPYHPKCYLVFEKDLSLVKTSSTGSSESMLNETLSSFSCTAFHISNGRKVNLLLDMSRVDKDLREKMEGGMYSRRLSCS